MDTNRIATITLDETSILRRSETVAREREVALRDLVEDNSFTPVRAAENGHVGPWDLKLAVREARLELAIHDAKGEEAGLIALGTTRFRRVIREYFAICDSYYKALRQASAPELETIDMARRGIHDRGTRHLMDALDGKVDTDFATARRLFTLLCVLHIKG
ncbi:UPF0262 family protein [Paraurantiacibacter namhicola]|nr:UPF0262 family protein [Paraurantiacibacter namhicola]